jgi:purine-binding chemotaxis protein CheW
MNNNYVVATKTSIIENTEHYIVFTINAKKYAINIKNVMEVINLPQIDISSITPKGIIGMTNYNGLMVKVIDLCPFLGFETSKFSVNDKLIIIIANDNCYAVRVEEIENITNFNLSDIQPIPYEIQDSIIKNLYKENENAISIIDINLLNKIISENHTEKNIIDYTLLLPNDEKSQQIIKLRQQQTKPSKNTFSFPVDLTNVNQYILFTIDKNNYYLDLKHVKEFISIKRLNITKLPYTKNYVKGLISIRGNFIVVVDLKKFINENSTSTIEGNKLIVVENENFDIAFLVDDIKYIKKLKNIQQKTSFGENSKYVYCEFVEDNELYTVLNFDKIINDDRLYININ